MSNARVGQSANSVGANPGSFTAHPPTSGWKEYIDWISMEYKDSFLASRYPVIDVVNADKTVRPPGRFVSPANERRVVVMGKVPDISGGIKMGIQGNRSVRPATYMTPIRDGENIQDILSLVSMKGQIYVLEHVWNDQLETLKEIDRAGEVEAVSMPLMSAPFKFHGTVKGAIKGSSGLNTVERIDVLWEKFRTIPADSNTLVIEDRNLKNVGKDSVYSPKVLDYGAEPYCHMKNDALVQHAIYDDHGYLVPPWEVMNEIRPGSIVLAVGAIHERNIETTYGGVKGYDRHYEIRGCWAKVIKRGKGHPQSFTVLPIPRSLHPGVTEMLGRSKTLIDYPGFNLVEQKKKINSKRDVNEDRRINPY